jgi:hypothetical protein
MKSILTQLDKRPRFAPIRNLTPEKLVRMLDAFEQGYLAEANATTASKACINTWRIHASSGPPNKLKRTRLDTIGHNNFFLLKETL